MSCQLFCYPRNDYEWICHKHEQIRYARYCEDTLSRFSVLTIDPISISIVERHVDSVVYLWDSGCIAVLRPSGSGRDALI